jgi:hypothetical protein
MAAAITERRLVASRPFLIEELTLITLEAGQQVVVTHQGTDGVAPFRAMMNVTTRATDGSPVLMSYESSDTSLDTVTLRFDTEVGGDLTGAVVKVFLEWHESADGGIS